MLTLISWVLPFSAGFVVHPLAHGAAIPGASFCAPERVSRDTQITAMHDHGRFPFLHVAGMTKVGDFFCFVAVSVISKLKHLKFERMLQQLKKK